MELERAVRSAAYVGESSGTLYFWCNVSCLSDYRGAIHACRRTLNGFRLTATQEKRFPGADLLELSYASQLSSPDASAWARLLSYRLGTRFGNPPGPQHSDASTRTSTDGYREPSTDILGDFLNTELSASDAEPSPATSAATTLDMPPAANGAWQAASTVLEVDRPLGEDPEADALIQAAAVYHMVMTCPAYAATDAGSAPPEHLTSSVNKASTLASNNDCLAPGQPPKFYSPSRADVRNAQFAHPATRLLLAALGAEPPNMPCAMLPCTPAEGDADYAQFLLEVGRHELSGDGLLLRRQRRQHVSANGEIFEYGPRCMGRIVLPPKYQTWALSCHHDQMGHPGVRRGLPPLLRRYFWDTQDAMRADLSSYCGDCQVCARCKVARHRLGDARVPGHGEHPFDIASADYYSVGLESRRGAVVNVSVKIGEPSLDASLDEVTTIEDEPEDAVCFDGTVSFACQFSRLIKVAAVRGQPTSRTISRILLHEVIQHYGTPRAIRSDHGSNFVSAVIKALYARYGIRMEASAPYMHRTIGLVERWHSVLKHLILTHHNVTNDARWHAFLPFMVLSFNNAINSTTGYAPFFIANLRDCRLPMDSLSSPVSLTQTERKLPDWFAEHLAIRGIVYNAVSHKLELSQLHRLRAFNLKRDVVSKFLPGDKCLIIKGKVIDKQNPKAEEPTEGPFTILRQLDNGNYELADLHTRRLINLFNVERLIHFPSRRTIAQCELADWYPVERVTNRRISSDGASLEYRLHWAGFGKSYQVWMPSEYLVDIAPLLADYNTKYPLPPEFLPEPQPRESRESNDTPLPDALAQNRVHFRRRRPCTTPVAEATPPPAPATSPGPEPIAVPTVAAPLSPPLGPAVPDPDSENIPEPVTITTDTTDLLEFSELDGGTAVEIKFTQVPKGVVQLNSWLPATVKRTRHVPARPGRLERKLVVVTLDNDRAAREHTVDLGGLSESLLRLARHSVAASISLVQPTWVRCNHGAVLVTASDGNATRLTSFPLCSLECCIASCGEWFAKFSSTTTWCTSFGGGRFPSVFSTKGL